MPEGCEKRPLASVVSGRYAVTCSGPIYRAVQPVYPDPFKRGDAYCFILRKSRLYGRPPIFSIKIDIAFISDYSFFPGSLLKVRDLFIGNYRRIYDKEYQVGILYPPPLGRCL